VVYRWQHESAARARDPATEAWAALLQACLCRRGVEQMDADADEAARKAAAVGLVAPAVGLMQGIARILCGDLDGGEAFLKDAASAGADVGSHEILAITLAERSLVAIACGDWSQAEAFANQALTVLRDAGIEDGYATPLVYAVRAHTAWHRVDTAAAQQQLSHAQRLRPVLTYALPHLAVQARLELIRVCLALGDLMGARTLMREIDEVLKRRPLLGTLVGEAQALRTQVSKRRGYDSPAASSLTAAELRLLPLLSTHLTFTRIGRELFLSPNTVKTQAVAIYRKLGASTRSEAVARSRELGLLEG
jgi:LuxR family maltose regulon positive regulatory protein